MYFGVDSKKYKEIKPVERWNKFETFLKDHNVMKSDENDGGTRRRRMRRRYLRSPKLDIVIRPRMTLEDKLAALFESPHMQLR